MAGQAVSWKDVVARAATDSGLPKKTIEEGVTAVANTLEVLIKETRPKQIGDKTTIKTPLGAYRVTHVAERVITNPKTGEQSQRPACYGISVGVPRNFIDSGNSGINLEKKPLAGGTAPKKVEAAPAKKTA